MPLGQDLTRTTSAAAIAVVKLAMTDEDMKLMIKPFVERTFKENNTDIIATMMRRTTICSPALMHSYEDELLRNITLRTKELPPKDSRIA